ncbi:MAG: glycosyltransferase family 4 protein [Bacteroidales bacterium]|jgi:glycosyltransferase involved in cell wall biosynthesis|nr:glycosyltransferase family 4 protein [Bacteroidales bacterium]
MRLLVLNYEYPPLGGRAGVITRNISERLANRNNKITVITTWFDGEPEDITDGSLRVIRLKSKRKYIFRSDPKEMLSWMSASKKFLREHLKTEKYDLCLANFALPGGEVAYSMKLIYGLPYVILSHGHDIPWLFPEQMMWYHALTYHWIHKICLQSERNYIRSKDMKDNIDSFLGKKFSSKNMIINNGWDSSIFKPDYSKRSRQFIILFPGRLVKQKEPLIFLQAIKILKDQIPEFKVHILGDGYLRKKMEIFVSESNLNNTVIFKSWISQEEMLHEYQTASLTVLPSLNGDMSIATLEAITCGQYLITTKVPNNNDLIIPNINGNFIEKNNPGDIAKKIFDYYSEKFSNGYLLPVEELGKYHKLFEWDKIIDMYEEDFDKIILEAKLKRDL